MVSTRLRSGYRPQPASQPVHRRQRSIPTEERGGIPEPQPHRPGTLTRRRPSRARLHGSWVAVGWLLDDSYRLPALRAALIAATEMTNDDRVDLCLNGQAAMIVGNGMDDRGQVSIGVQNDRRHGITSAHGLTIRLNPWVRALAAIRVVDACGGQAIRSLRLGSWSRLPTRYGTRTGSWRRRRWSTRSSRASRREGWPQLRSPTTWDRTPRSSMRSAARMPWLWPRAPTEMGCSRLG